MSIFHLVSATSMVLAVFCLYSPTVDAQIADLTNNPPHMTSKYICPDAEDIAPCECSEEHGLFHKVLDLYCEEIADEQQLYDIFHSNLPVSTFRKLTLDTRNIVSLSDNVFGNATFEEVITLYAGIGGSALSSVDPKTFIKSAATLKMLAMYGNQLSEFPYETLSDYTKLDYFGIAENPLLSFPVIENEKLRILFSGSASYDVIPDGALDGLPNLEQFTSMNTTVATVPTGLFASNPNLLIIYMSDCKLEHLESGQFEVTSTRLMSIYLHYNNIRTVDPGAFKGLQSGEIKLEYNQLTTVPEATWKPLMEAGLERVFLEGNPLICGCDVAWLVLEPTYHHFVSDATCQNGTMLVDLDPSYFENNC